MSSDSSRPTERDPLQNLLEDAESELRSRLQEACEAEAKGVSTESTEEIRRLEDNLLAAAMAAKQTIAVRRHMKGRRPVERERPMKIDAAADRDAHGAPEKRGAEFGAGKQGESSVMGVREFTDDKGHPWRAWAVVPGQTRASSGGRQFLGAFQDGWICFESLGASARRRLPFGQASWANISDEELSRLLEEAIDAPIRVRTPPEKR